MDIPAYEVHQLQFATTKTKYCVGIPILNEDGKIQKQLMKMKALGIHKIADIIIFDGNSTDGSTDHPLLTDFGVHTLLVKTGPGKQGAQFRMGFSYILEQGYKGIVTIDGNNKDSVESIPDFINALDEGYDFVQGSRFIKDGHHENTPLSRLFAVKVIHAPWLSLISGRRWTDTTSAFRGISSKFLKDKKLNLFRDIFSAYELLFYMTAKAKKLGYKTKEIPVTRVYPPKGKTPTKITWKGNFKIINDLWKLSIGYYN